MAVAIRPAVPARTPEVPPMPFKVTTAYARLLASDPHAKGMESEGACAMANMVLYMRSLVAQGTPYTAEYRKLLELFEFAGEARNTQQNAKEMNAMAVPLVFFLPASHAMLKRLARRAMRRVQEQGTVLVPCFSARHAMYLQIDREAAGYTLRIFNTGDGLDHDDGRPRHTHRGGDKWQSMYVVRDVRAGDADGCLNARRLLELLRAPVLKVGGLQTVDDIYAWANALGTPHNPPRYAVQAMQKSGSCTHKSILAVARNHLSDVAYCELLARLREQAYANYTGRNHRSLRRPLMDLFAQRVASARAKAEGAKLQKALRSQHARDSWMVESVDRKAMDEALWEAWKRHGQAFMISYRHDTHRLALSTADRAGIRHTALIPTAGRLATPQTTYEDLRTAARHWRHKGYTQIGRSELEAVSKPVTARDRPRAPV